MFVDDTVDVICGMHLFLFICWCLCGVTLVCVSYVAGLVHVHYHQFSHILALHTTVAGPGLTQHHLLGQVVAVPITSTEIGTGKS